MPSRFPVLRPFYYLDHFEEMIAFLEGNCGNLLGDEEKDLIGTFRMLPMESRALLVRMTNRKGSVFRVDAMRYKEIGDPDGSLDILREKRFIRQPDKTDLRGVVGALRRDEIVSFLKPRKGLSGKTKAELVELCEGCDVPPETFASFVVLERLETLQFLLFLYFGKSRESLTALALRDLGVVGTRAGQKEFDVRFKSRAAATGAFFYSQLRDEISGATQAGLVRLKDEMGTWPEAEAGEGDVQAAREREICRLGSKLEKAGMTEEALEVYLRTEAHPARERSCRILFAKGEREAAGKVLEAIISSPASDEELLFAEDFHARKFGGKRLSRLTEMLREAPAILIDEAFRDGAEQAAANYFRKQGVKAWRTENHLWDALFGMLFWNLLQGAGGGTKHNEFENRPTQLKDGTFYLKNRAAIDAQLALLHGGKALGYVEGIFEKHYGEPNGVFAWRQKMLESVSVLLESGRPEAIAEILLRIAKDPNQNGVGYPDLMVMEDGHIRFIEIKAEGDQIRRHQLVQLLALERAGFDVGVVRVEWFADPRQEYVVVDIETTGGRAADHRITEIGAVKVRDGVVTGIYESFVNPQRGIPRKITQLTGITDAMVADAPVFAEIGGAFREFVGDAVFVAHSVRFDYGFIRQEYGRMGESFRRPTLCTVVAMRKFFPGLSSYGLKHLTEYFGISLKTHHRALCDAEATAELLLMINSKRKGQGEKLAGTKA